MVLLFLYRYKKASIYSLPVWLFLIIAGVIVLVADA